VLDVPRNARLKVETTSGDVTIEDVSDVEIRGQSGVITIAKAKGRFEATTVGGEIVVRDSTGTFTLITVGGTVDARNVGPSNATDAFQAVAVGGDINLDRVQHQRLKANTVSGEINYSGPLARGGRYSFDTLSGDLKLFLPAASSFQLTGSVGEHGSVKSEFDLKYSRGDTSANGSNHGPTRRIEAVVGEGNALINLSLFSGSLHIRKK
jgi:DUF4097 and DUF4098 domain-containing protein YvlB